MRVVAILAGVLALAVGVACKRSRTSADRATNEGAAASGVDGAANEEVEDLAATLEPFRAKGELPALGAAVWRGSKLVAVGVTGVRKSGDATPVTPDDRWHLGSDTKAMTATLVGLAIDRGKLHFEDTVASMFTGENLDPGWAKVTLEQLLQHRGGAPAKMPPDIWDQMWADGAGANARVKAVKALLARSPAQAPGTFDYANAGYMIAGVALERAESMTWEAIIARDLFAPLHMASCSFGAPGTVGKVDAPWGHRLQNGALLPEGPGPKGDNPPSLGPAGTVHCSLRDWGKFLAVHLAGARDESTLLSKASMTRLHTPLAGGDYAAGWGVVSRPWAGGVALTHGGSNTMWKAVTWIAPAKNVTFAVVTNRGDQAAFNACDTALGPLIKKYAP